MKQTKISKHKYSLVVCSSDAYSDTWKPHFTLLKKYWNGISEIPIILNTESLKFDFPELNIISPQLFCSKSESQTVSWSRRLRETLDKFVHTEQVIIIFDDYFLRGPVNVEKLSICSDFLFKRQHAAYITLFPPPPPYYQIEDYPWIVKRPKHAPYILNFQVGLWQTNKLIHYLRDHESPWYFERWGSKRARWYSDEFYGVIQLNGEPLMFDYLASKEGISSGLWFPATKELFDKENIDLDLSIRGVMPKNYKAPLPKRNWIKTVWNIFRSLRP